MDKMIENTKELMEEQMPSFDFLLDEEAERNSLLAEHRAWLGSSPIILGICTQKAIFGHPCLMSQVGFCRVLCR